MKARKELRFVAVALIDIAVFLLGMVGWLTPVYLGYPPVGLGHVVEQDRPDPLGILPDGAGNLGDRHPAAGQEQHHRFQEQREAPLGPGPRHRHLLDTGSGVAIDAGDMGVHVALELEEVQVTLGTRLAVVDRGRLARVRVWEAASGREIHLDVEALEFGVEALLDHLPWRAGQTEGQGEDVLLVHGDVDSTGRGGRHHRPARRINQPGGGLRAPARAAGRSKSLQLTHTKSSGAAFLRYSPRHHDGQY